MGRILSIDCMLGNFLLNVRHCDFAILEIGCFCISKNIFDLFFTMMQLSFLEKIDSLDFLDGTRSTFSLEVIILHY
jgi:hypothetical protein